MSTPLPNPPAAPVSTTTATTATGTGTSGSGTATPTPLLKRNLFTLVGILVAVSWWLLHFTDWFETAATLIGLGGLFTWVGVVLKEVPEQELKGLKETITGPVFGSPNAWKWMLGVFGGLFFLSLLAGSIQIEGGKGAADARVKVYRVNSTQPEDHDADALPAAGRLRFVCWPSLCETDYYVKVTGLPRKKVPVRRWLWTWKPERLLAPGDFLQPIVLIGTDSNVGSTAEHNNVTLKLSVQRKEKGKYKDVKGSPFENKFTGRAVWVGCEPGDVDLPADVQKRWEQALAIPQAANRLLPPASLDHLPGELLPDDILTVEVRQNAAVDPRLKLVSSAVYIVRQPTGIEDMVQIITLVKK